MQTTPILGLKKPEYTDPADIQFLNYNSDTLDELFASVAKFKSGTGLFTTRGVSQTFIDSSVKSTDEIEILITGSPNGIWDVDSADGSFTITSDTPETVDVGFNYFVHGTVI
jgi:hypothetical protein